MSDLSKIIEELVEKRLQDYVEEVYQGTGVHSYAESCIKDDIRKEIDKRIPDLREALIDYIKTARIDIHYSSSSFYFSFKDDKGNS